MANFWTTFFLDSLFSLVVLEETELHQQKVIKADHVIDLVSGEDQHKPREELPEAEAALEPVPDGNSPDPQDHENAEDDEHPADDPGAGKQLFFVGKKHLRTSLGAEEKCSFF